MTEIVTHAFAAAFLIFWGCKLETTGNRLWLSVGMYLIAKVAPIIVGLVFAFNLYAQFMGWPI